MYTVDERFLRALRCALNLKADTVEYGYDIGGSDYQCLCVLLFCVPLLLGPVHAIALLVHVTYPTRINAGLRWTIGARHGIRILASTAQFSAMDAPNEWGSM